MRGGGGGPHNRAEPGFLRVFQNGKEAGLQGVAAVAVECCTMQLPNWFRGTIRGDGDFGLGAVDG